MLILMNWNILSTKKIWSYLQKGSQGVYRRFWPILDRFSPIKIHVRRATGRGYLNSLVYVCVCICIYLFLSSLLAKRKTIQTWNLAHILPLTLSKNRFFYFFDQITVTAASLEKLPCHVDFPHISSISLLLLLLLLTTLRSKETILNFLGRALSYLQNVSHRQTDIYIIIITSCAAG